MTRREMALWMVKMLPRFDDTPRRQPWRIDGTHAIFNGRQLEGNIYRAVAARYRDKSFGVPSRIGYIRVSACRRLRFVQQRVLVSRLIYYIKKRGWQRWTNHRLPIVIKYRGRYIIWNGTHRTIACLLLDHRLHCRMLDLDKESRRTCAT